MVYYMTLSILELHAIKIQTSVWAWYNPIAETKVENWFKETASNLWPHGLTTEIAWRSKAV